METNLEIMLEQSPVLCKNEEPHQLKLFGEKHFNLDGTTALLQVHLDKQLEANKLM